MKTLEIDRGWWLTAEWSMMHGGSKLLALSGMMCCLGFLCKRLGLKDSEILNLAVPTQLYRLIPEGPHKEWMISPSSVGRLTGPNDNHATRAEREDVITTRFAEKGIAVTFVGRYPTAAQVEKRIQEGLNRARTGAESPTR